MPRIIDEINTESPIARLIIPATGQLIIICKNHIYKAAVTERLEEHARSRSYSGDSIEDNYTLAGVQQSLDSPQVTVRTLNIVVSGDIKKCLNVLINASLISIATYRQGANEVSSILRTEREDHTPSP